MADGAELLRARFGIDLPGVTCRRKWRRCSIGA